MTDHPGPGTSATGGAARRTAQRPSWSALPAAVRDAVEARCGSTVAAARSQDAGFTHGLASRLELADGSRLFLKGAPTAGDWVADSYRREAQIVAGLPSAVRAPALVWTLEVSGWFLAAYEDVSGRHPHRPWAPQDVAAVLETLTRHARALTPPPDGIEAGLFTAEFADYADNLATLDPATVPAAVAAEAHALALRVLDQPATTLSHSDLRDDNLLLAEDGEVRVFDWNHVSVGPPYLDLVGLLCSVAGDGFDADALLAAHPLTRDVDPDLVDGTLALLVGYYVVAAAQPEVATSPALRTHQRWYRDAIWGWLTSRRGWDPQLRLG